MDLTPLPKDTQKYSQYFHKKISAYFERVDHSWFEKDLSELELKVCPERDDFLLRRRVQLCLDRAVRTNTIVYTKDITDGVCTNKKFLRALNNPAYVAWLVIPIKKYEDDLHVLLDLGVRRMYEILSKSLIMADGELDIKRLPGVLSLLKQIENRIHGQAVQRIQADHLINNNERPRTVTSAPDFSQMDSAQIDQQLRALEQRAVIDLQAESIDPDEDKRGPYDIEDPRLKASDSSL